MILIVHIFVLRLYFSDQQWCRICQPRTISITLCKVQAQYLMAKDGPSKLHDWPWEDRKHKKRDPIRPIVLAHMRHAPFGAFYFRVFSYSSLILSVLGGIGYRPLPLPQEGFIFIYFEGCPNKPWHWGYAPPMAKTRHCTCGKTRNFLLPNPLICIFL